MPGRRPQAAVDPTTTGGVVGTTVTGGGRTGSRRPTTGSARTSDPSGALVRLPVVTGAWAESIPPVPDGHVVTVSFSTAAAAEEHAEAFALLGYRVVGTGPLDTRPPRRPADSGHPVAWLVVSGGLARRHHLWWEGVRDHADGVFVLSMGPVVARFADVLRAHFAEQ